MYIGKRIDIKNEVIRTKNGSKHAIISLLLIVLLCLILYMRVSLSVPFQGDSVRHVNIAKQFVDDGYITPSIKNILVDSTNNKPISYPILFHIFLATVYIFLGNVGIKLIPVLCSILINILIFLIIKILTKKDWAGVLGILFALSLQDFPRYSSFVFIETLLTVFCFLSVFYFIKSLSVVGNSKTLLILGIFIGTMLSLKLMGFYMLILPILYFLFKRNIYHTTIIFLGILIISATFLGFQLHTTGTIFNPGFAIFFHPNSDLAKMTDKQSLMQIHNSQHEFIRAIYAKSFVGLQDFLYLTNSPLRLNIVLLIFSILYLTKNNRKILRKISFLYALPLSYSLFYLIAPNLRYHFPYRLFVIFLFIFGVLLLFKLVNNKKLVKLLIILTFSIILIPSTVNNTNSLIYSKELIMYQSTEGGYYSLIEAAEWLKDNTPKNSIILGTPEPDIAYYSQRPVLWITSYGGSKIPELFQTQDETVALEICSNYNINYIWLGRYQIKKVVTWVQFVPENGLPSLIDKFEHFKLVFRNKDISIYKVKYES